MSQFTQEILINQEYDKVTRGIIDGIEISFSHPERIECQVTDENGQKQQPKALGIVKQIRIYFTKNPNQASVYQFSEDGKWIGFSDDPNVEPKPIRFLNWKSLTFYDPKDPTGTKIIELKSFKGFTNPQFIGINNADNFMDYITKALVNKITITQGNDNDLIEWGNDGGSSGGLGNEGTLPIQLELNTYYPIAGRNFKQITIFFDELFRKSQNINNVLVQDDSGNKKNIPLDNLNYGVFLNYDRDPDEVRISEIDVSGHETNLIKHFPNWKIIKVQNSNKQKNPTETIKGIFSDKNDGFSPVGVEPTPNGDFFDTGPMIGDQNAATLVLLRVGEIEPFEPIITSGPDPKPFERQVDSLGVVKIYRDAPNGSKWLFTKENPEWLKDIGDKYVKNTQEPEIIKIQKDGDKEEDVKDMEVKLMILANGQSGKDVKECGFSTRRTNGFTVSDKDWRNVEFTIYIQHVSGGCTGKGRKGGDYLSLIFRTCQNGEKLCGAAYRINIDTCSAGVWAEKELYQGKSNGQGKSSVKTTKTTNNIIDRGWKELANIGNTKYLGIKGIIFNNPDNNNVKEIYLALLVDKNGNNQWERVKFWVDKKDTGSDFPTFDQEVLKDENIDDPLITFAAPHVILELNSTEFNLKKVSAQEIAVPVKAL